MHTFTATVWLYPGDAAWHFITVPQEISDTIAAQFALVKRGWGSLRVSVTIGSTTWNTSIFPSKEHGAYILPVKAEVRKKENLQAGSTAKIQLTVNG